MAPFLFWQFCLGLFAGFTVVGVRAFGFGFSLGHVGAFLGLAVVLGAHAVVSIGFAIAPYFTSATASCENAGVRLGYCLKNRCSRVPTRPSKISSSTSTLIFILVPGTIVGMKILFLQSR